MIKKYFRLSMILSLSMWSFGVFAQEMDCASTIKYRYASAPFQFDKQTKSAVCYTGQKYEYVVYLFEGVDYRFSFFASSIFNNNIRFKIININTGELVLDLPGAASENNTSAILQDYYDPNRKKFIHPYYDLLPEQNSNYKVIVEVGDQKSENEINNASILVDSNQTKGCVTIFLQSKMAENYGF